MLLECLDHNLVIHKAKSTQLVAQQQSTGCSKKCLLPVFAHDSVVFSAIYNCNPLSSA
jgi:hypothetical protein